MDEKLPSPAPQAAKPPRNRRFSIRLFLLLLVLGALVVFLPQIVANTPLRGMAIKRLTRDLRGSLHVGGASLAWWSPPELRELELRDEKGQVIASASNLRLSRSLFSLAIDHDDLGAISIDEPVINWNCETNESNIEQSLARYLDTPSSNSPTRTSLRIAARARQSNHAGRGFASILDRERRFRIGHCAAQSATADSNRLRRASDGG